MNKRTRSNLNPHRIPNVAKYRSIANRDDTWTRMVNSTNFAGPNGCWEWTNSISENGYGVYNHHEMGGVLAHRLALHIVGRPVPEHLTVDHLCRNRRCINPAHLDTVPIAINILRGNTAGGRNARKTHCVHGHEFTPENTYVGKSRSAIGTPTRTCKTCARLRYVSRRSA